MFGNQSDTSGFSGTFDTVIGEDSRFKGTIKGEGSLRIEGLLEGEVIYEGMVVVGQNAEVDADIYAEGITIAGEVRGNVETKGKLEITSSGKLFGGLVAQHLQIEKGAVFKGNSKMGTEEQTSDKLRRLSEERRTTEAETETKRGKAAGK